MILNISMACIALFNIKSFLHTESPVIVAVTAVIGTCLAIANLLSISRDSRARTRPYIILEPKLGVHNNGSIDLVISNHGNSPARKIKVEIIDPWEEKEEDYITQNLLRALDREFFLTPGAHVRLMWRNVRQDAKAGADDIHYLAISYYATSGFLGFRNKYMPYRDKFTIDTGYTLCIPMPEEGARSNSKDSKELKALEDIKNALHTLNRHIGSMR
ncbi:hypothetical protein [Rothia dentocariosa]|uniref:hypothetical protein n=1 Tax=Rothia dentocariosa TaxID=2047 RepID=UPI000AC7E69D|nr:hypothetical protein [Rothia dentocariosa]